MGMYCSNCGKEIKAEHDFCGHCGFDVKTAQGKSEPVFEGIYSEQKLKPSGCLTVICCVLGGIVGVFVGALLGGLNGAAFGDVTMVHAMVEIVGPSGLLGGGFGAVILLRELKS